nr:immunoglobulin light chain junction region [Macaca mulatta]
DYYCYSSDSSGGFF